MVHASASWSLPGGGPITAIVVNTSRDASARASCRAQVQTPPTASAVMRIRIIGSGNWGRRHHRDIRICRSYGERSRGRLRLRGFDAIRGALAAQPRGELEQPGVKTDVRLEAKQRPRTRDVGETVAD